MPAVLDIFIWASDAVTDPTAEIEYKIYAHTYDYDSTRTVLHTESNYHNVTIATDPGSEAFNDNKKELKMDIEY